MSRPDPSRRRPGQDAPRASQHAPDDARTRARPPAAETAGLTAEGQSRDRTAPPAAAGEGVPTPDLAEAADWDAWERDAGRRAGGHGEDDAADDEDDDGHDGPAPDDSRLIRVRIDKWLWAARFFRTRSLAKEAIEGGKVHCDGQRVKVSKDIRVGMTLDVRQGFDEKVVVVRALSEVRGPASVAQRLYEETAESVAAREQRQADRRAHNLAHPDHRPSKKDRRQIHRFKDSWGE